MSGDQVAREGAVIADDRTAGDERLDQAARRFRCLVAEQENIRLPERAQNVVMRRRPGQDDATGKAAILNARLHRSLHRTVADPGCTEVDAVVAQARKNVDPVHRALHEFGPAGIDDAQRSIRGCRFLGFQFQARDVVSGVDMDIVNDRRYSAVRRVDIEGFAAVKQAQRGPADHRPFEHGRGAPGERCAQPRSPGTGRSRLAHDTRFHPVRPDRVGALHPVSFDAGHGAPVAEKAADREGQVVRILDQRRDPAARGGQVEEEPIGAIGHRHGFERHPFKPRPCRKRNPARAGQRGRERHDRGDVVEIGRPEAKSVAGLVLQMEYAIDHRQRDRCVDQQSAGHASASLKPQPNRSSRISNLFGNNSKKTKLRKCKYK